MRPKFQHFERALSAATERAIAASLAEIEHALMIALRTSTKNP